jgi:hypothetical protein
MGRTKTKMAAMVGVGALIAVGTSTVAVKEIQAHRTYPGLAGLWEGTYFKQHVALRIARTNGTYLARFHYIDSGMDIPASDLKVGRNAISFRVAGETDKFAASIDPGMTQMSGNWREGTNSYPVALKRTANPDVSEPLTETDYTPRAGSDLQGFWQGIVKAGPWEFGATLKIAEPVAGSFRAEMDGVEWGGEHIPASSMTRDGNTIKIGFRLLGNFEGKLDTDTGQLAGNWTRGDKPAPVTFSRVDLQADEASKNYIPASPLELQGHWKGTLELPNGKLHFVFHIAKLPDGSLSATMDNPDQGANNILATTTQYSPPKVSILLKGIGGVFNGALKNGKLTGMWRQQGKVHPLTLNRD